MPPFRIYYQRHTDELLIVRVYHQADPSRDSATGSGWHFHNAPRTEMVMKAADDHTTIPSASGVERPAPFRQTVDSTRARQCRSEDLRHSFRRRDGRVVEGARFEIALAICDGVLQILILAGGEAHLKARELAVEDEETRRLKSVVADLATEKDLLKEKIRRLEAGRPLGWWRSKR